MEVRCKTSNKADLISLAICEIWQLAGTYLRQLSVHSELHQTSLWPLWLLDPIYGQQTPLNGIPQTRTSEILKGNRRITADTALRLSRYFGNSAKFWLGIQDDYDIEEGELQKKLELNSIKQFTVKAA